MFQSTRPARGATVGRARCCACVDVSIHAPRAGRDDAWRSTIDALTGFNPRAPRGARRGMRVVPSRQSCFNPRAPRGARRERCGRLRRLDQCFNPRAPRGARQLDATLYRPASRVSIHAPRAGRDMRPATSAYRSTCFNPRAPRGARRGSCEHHDPCDMCFNPRAPRGARRSIVAVCRRC